MNKNEGASCITTHPLNIEPLARLELATYALRMRCSTN